MTGWLVTTAIVGAAAVGPMAYGQAARWTTVFDDTALSAQVSPAVAPAPVRQSARVFANSGGRIGVTIRDLSEEEIKGDKAGGVMIDRVEAASPAEKAGFKDSDIIVEFDGERVRSSRQFTRLVQETPPGRPVAAAVLRGGQRVSLTVQPREGNTFQFFDKLDDLGPERVPKVVPNIAIDVLPKFEMFLRTGRLGVTVEDLSAQLADYFGTKDGVLVKSVEDNSIAAKAGVKAGDVITALDGGAISTAADLRRRTQRLETGDEFTLGIVRDKKTLSVKGKIEPIASPRSTPRTIL